jgi:hypothetical protein
VSAGGKVVGTVTMSSACDLSVAAVTAVALSISGFAKGDTLRLAGFAAGPNETLAFVENAAKTSGTLRVTDGTKKATVTLFGQYVAAGFDVISDGAVGSVVTYSSATAALHEIAGTGPRPATHL